MDKLSFFIWRLKNFTKKNYCNIPFFKNQVTYVSNIYLEPLAYKDNNLDIKDYSAQKNQMGKQLMLDNNATEEQKSGPVFISYAKADIETATSSGTLRAAAL